MWKKIIIGLLVVTMAVGAAGMYTYRKVEAQFESFIMAEVERKRAEAEAAIEEKLQEEADKALEAKLNEVEEVVELDDEEIPLGSVEPPTTEETTEDSNEESSDQTSTEGSSEQASTSSEEENTTVEKDTSEQTASTETTEQKETKPENKTAAETTQKQTTESKPKETVQETVKEEEVVEEVYTESDFERDKKIAMDLALSRLTAKQISRLIDISAGGFTPEEKQEAKEMFYSNFTADEQAWILDIYTKYYFLVSEG